MARPSVVLVLGLLAAIPIWLIPVAPLTDWPIHLAMAQEAYLLTNGMASSQYYHTDFLFLGYSLLQFLLIGLQSFMSVQMAGQIVLTLLFVLTPVCWWAFFHILDSEKEEWAVFGLLFNYSIFFYFGMINYLLATSIGLVWVAVGLDAIRKGRERLPAFVALGILTAMSHAYVFLLLGGILALAAAYKWIYLGKRVAAMTLLLLMLLGGIVLADSMLNKTISRDQTYAKQASACAISVDILSGNTTRTSGEFVGETIAGTSLAAWQYNPVVILRTAFVSPILELMVLMALLGFGMYLVNAFIQKGEAANTILHEHIISKIPAFDKFYLAIAIILYIHFLLMPPCPAGICMMNVKSLIPAFAFLLLAISGKHIVQPLAVVYLAVVLLNIIAQGFAFNEHRQVQADIEQQLAAMVKQMPDNSTVFIAPGWWNSANTSAPKPIFVNPHYQALLLIQNPKIYVAGLFMHQDTFVLRSDFPLYDEMVNLGPTQADLRGNVSACYLHPPMQYNYVIDGNLKMRQNKQN